MTATEPVTFRVNSIPVAQPRQRHRVLTVAGKSFAQNYTPTRAPVNVFKAAVQLEAGRVFRGRIFEGPVAVSFEFVMPRPKSLIWKSKPMPRVWCPKKPDVENLTKSLADALTGYAYRDDAQVVSLFATKFIAGGNESPHVNVIIREVEGYQ